MLNSILCACILLAGDARSPYVFTTISMLPALTSFDRPIADGDGPLAHEDDAEVGVARVVDVGDGRVDAATQRSRLEKLAVIKNIGPLPNSVKKLVKVLTVDI